MIYVTLYYESRSRQTLKAFTTFMNSKKLFKSSILSPNPHNYNFKTCAGLPFTSKRTLKMPLVVPGINSGGSASKTEEWTNKLVGKKIGEGSSDEIVCLSSPVLRCAANAD